MQAMHAQRVFALPEVEEWTGTVAHPRRAGDLAPTRSPPHRGCVPRHREIGHFHPWDGSLQPLLIFDSKLTTQAQSDPRTEAISFAKIGANTPVATDSWRNPTESG
jgi:hypothetical protein